MRFWARKVLSLAIGALIAVSVGGVWLTVLERQHHVYARFIRIEDLAEIEPVYPPNSAEAEYERRFSGDDPIEIMDQVRDAVVCVDSTLETEDPSVLLAHVESGGGLLCGGIANVYRAALAANGFPARITTLARFLTDPYDTHVVVEVREDGRWVVYDPTFGTVFERNGERLGAQEIKHEFLSGGLDEVQTVAVDESAAYPARLDDYYMDWPALFSNVVVREQAVSVWEKLPIVRWWAGEHRYYEVTDGHFGRNVEFVNAIYWVTAVLLPAALLALLALIVGISIYLWRVPAGPGDA